MVCCAQALSLGKTLSHWFSRASPSENKISRWEEEKRARTSEVTQKKLFGKEKTWELAGVSAGEGGGLRPCDCSSRSDVRAARAKFTVFTVCKILGPSLWRLRNLETRWSIWNEP